MSMSRVIDGKSNEGYFDSKAPVYGETVRVKAYLENHFHMWTSAEPPMPYVRLVLRDINGRSVAGFLFNSDLFEGLSESLAVLTKTPVFIQYHLNSSTRSLAPYFNISDITSCKDSDFPWEKFLGKVEDSEKMFEISNKMLDQVTGNLTLEPSLMLEGFSSLCDGRQGGFAALAYGVLREMATYKTLPGIDYAFLVRLTYMALNFYATHLRMSDKFEITLQHTTLLNAQRQIEQSNLLPEQSNVALETLTALVGASKPEHLYANLVVDGITHVHQALSKVFAFESMIEGSTQKWGANQKLSKY
jgi:hypothetical protein